MPANGSQARTPGNSAANGNVPRPSSGGSTYNSANAAQSHNNVPRPPASNDSFARPNGSTATSAANRGSATTANNAAVCHQQPGSKLRQPRRWLAVLARGIGLVSTASAFELSVPRSAVVLGVFELRPSVQQQQRLRRNWPWLQLALQQLRTQFLRLDIRLFRQPRLQRLARLFGRTQLRLQPELLGPQLRIEPVLLGALVLRSPRLFWQQLSQQWWKLA